mgnify:CR=1 FL=1
MTLTGKQQQVKRSASSADAVFFMGRTFHAKRPAEGDRRNHYNKNK